MPKNVGPTEGAGVLDVLDLAALECDSLESLVVLGHPFFSLPGLSTRIDPRHDPDGRLTQFHVAANTSQMLLECAVQHMNSLTDGFLLTLANSSVSATPQDLVRGQGRSRRTLELEVTAIIGRHLSSFEGWDAVLRVRRDANALKHRAGVTMFSPDAGGHVDAVSVDVTRQDVLESLAGVRCWLLGVVEAVQQAYRADGAR